MLPTPTATLAPILCVLLSGLVMACAPMQSEPDSSFEYTVDTQLRINRYFHSQVIPQLRDCWGGLSGEGKVLLRHVYISNGRGTWNADPDQLTVEDSELAQDQQKAAVECMQRAVAETSFAMAEAERGQEEFILHWGWPVPLPIEPPTPAALHVGPGGGVIDDCDGHGTPPGCKNCDHSNHAACEQVCVGKPWCIVVGPNACRLSQDRCASGGPFGLVGGSVVATQ